MPPEDPNRPRRTNPARPGAPESGQAPVRDKKSNPSPSVPSDRAVPKGQGGARQRGTQSAPAKPASGQTKLAPVRLVPNPTVQPLSLPIARAVDPRSVPSPVSNRPIPVRNARGADIQQALEDETDEEQKLLDEASRFSPPILISVVGHLLVLIVMGLWMSRKEVLQDVEVTAVPEDTIATEQALDNTDVLGDSLEADPNDPGTQAPSDTLPIVADPLSAPTFNPLGTGAVAGYAGGTGPAVGDSEGIIGAPNIGIALKGRSRGTRGRLLGRYGGTPGTERAVAKGLEWLARQQRSDGTWSLSEPYSDGVRPDNRVAATAMALIAFQGHGDTHKEGKYASVVGRGAKALVRMQNADGLFTHRDMQVSHTLYSHAQASIAVCELYGMTGDEEFKGPAEKAIAYAVRAQDKTKGGWKYQPNYSSDTSVTGWFVMALQSARMAKLKVPEETLANITRYLDSAQTNGGREYNYEPNGSPTLAVSAEGLLCRQYLGWKQNDPRLIEGLQALLAKPVSYDAEDRDQRDVYYWYYATQAMHHVENPTVKGEKVPLWNTWNAIMRERIPAHQVQSGREEGSWDAAGDKWGTFAGRLYTTCLSIYILEVYYRHLPIYSGYKYASE